MDTPPPHEDLASLTACAIAAGLGANEDPKAAMRALKELRAGTKKLKLPTTAELAMIAATLGPGDNPSEAVKGAMAFYLRAEAELEGIAALRFAYEREERKDPRQHKKTLPTLPYDEVIRGLYGDQEMHLEIQEKLQQEQERIARRHYPDREWDEVRDILKSAGFEWKRGSQVRKSFERQFAEIGFQVVTGYAESKSQAGDFESWWNKQKRTDDQGETYVAISPKILGQHIVYLLYRKRTLANKYTANSRAQAKAVRQKGSPNRNDV